jgi:hypothetical protein
MENALGRIASSIQRFYDNGPMKVQLSKSGRLITTDVISTTAQW